MSSSFFANSSAVMITGGDFTSINLVTQEPAEDILPLILGKRKERDRSELDGHWPKRRRQCSSRNSDGLLVVQRDEFNLFTELISSTGYRIHSASHGERVVAVKVFEGPRAKRDWTLEVDFCKRFIHSNTPTIIGISDGRSESPFVVFHGISTNSMQLLIAKALRTDLSKSVHLSMKAVKGLAAGLSYVKSQKISLSLGTTINDWKSENFDIFASNNDEPVIAINLPSVVYENGSVSQAFDVGSNDYDIELLNGLCQKLFSETNSLLYDDSPEREFDSYIANCSSSATQMVLESTSNIRQSGAILSPSRLTGPSKPSQIPRREVWWRRLDMGASNRSLDSIAQHFGVHLARFQLPLFDYPLRHIRAPDQVYSRQTSHRCPGYLREEITLTSDLSRSAIISHEYPSQSELCSGCGQLVRYPPPQGRQQQDLQGHQTPSSQPTPASGADNFAGTFFPTTATKPSPARPRPASGPPFNPPRVLQLKTTRRVPPPPRA